MVLLIVMGVNGSTIEIHSTYSGSLFGVLGVDGSTIGTHSTYSVSSIGSSWSRWEYKRNPLHLLKVVIYREFSE